MSVDAGLLAFVEQFGAPIFPCKPNAKAPLTRNGFKDASRDQAQIEKWAEQFPGCNWAMPTGALSGFAVLDVDVRPDQGKHGDEVLRQLETEHGALPDTTQVLTPSGGRHYWFRTNASAIQSGTDKLGVGLDVKADGGYVVIPPSAINGRAYTFEASSDPSDVGFAELPTWVTERLAKKTETPKADIREHSGPVDLLENIADGNALHDSLRDLAAHYVGLGLGFAEICKLLELALHALKAPRDERWQDRFGGIPKLVNSAIEKFRSPQSVGHLLEHGFWIHEAKLTLTLPYIVKGVFGMGQIIVCWGPPGSGKTFVIMEMAGAVGSGQVWRGRRTRKAVVIYVLAESSRAYAENRIAALKRECPAMADAKVLFIPLALDLLHAEHGDVDRVIETAKHLAQEHGEVALVVIDTLAVTFGGGDENKSEDMGQYVTNIKRIVTETSAAVFVGERQLS